MSHLVSENKSMDIFVTVVNYYFHTFGATVADAVSDKDLMNVYQVGLKNIC